MTKQEFINKWGYTVNPCAYEDWKKDIQSFNNLPDAKTMPSREEAEQRANELYSQAGQRRIHAFTDCYDWINERMKP
jgi:hypothetical protein